MEIKEKEMKLETGLYKLYRKKKITLSERFAILRGETTMEEVMKNKKYNLSSD